MSAREVAVILCSLGNNNMEKSLRVQRCSLYLWIFFTCSWLNLQLWNPGTRGISCTEISLHFCMVKYLHLRIVSVFCNIVLNSNYFNFMASMLFFAVRGCVRRSAALALTSWMPVAPLLLGCINQKRFQTWPSVSSVGPPFPWLEITNPEYGHLRFKYNCVLCGRFSSERLKGNEKYSFKMICMLFEDKAMISFLPA